MVIKPGLSCDSADRPELPGLTEEPSSARAATPEPRIVTRVPEPRAPQHNPKAEVIRREQTKKTHSFKVQPVPEYEHKEVHNFSVDFRRELEYVSITSFTFSAYTKIPLINLVLRSQRCKK